MSKDARLRRVAPAPLFPAKPLVSDRSQNLSATCEIFSIAVV